MTRIRIGCVVCAAPMRCLGSWRPYFCRPHWFALPLALRQRWMRETDYGATAPSTQLIEDVRQPQL